MSLGLPAAQAPHGSQPRFQVQRCTSNGQSGRYPFHDPARCWLGGGGASFSTACRHQDTGPICWADECDMEEEEKLSMAASMPLPPPVPPKPAPKLAPPVPAPTPTPAPALAPAPVPVPAAQPKCAVQGFGGGVAGGPICSVRPLWGRKF